MLTVSIYEINQNFFISMKLRFWDETMWNMNTHFPRWIILKILHLMPTSSKSLTQLNQAIFNTQKSPLIVPQRFFIFSSSFWSSDILVLRASNCVSKALADTWADSSVCCLTWMASAPERLTTARAKSENFIVVVCKKKVFLLIINMNQILAYKLSSF